MSDSDQLVLLDMYGVSACTHLIRCQDGGVRACMTGMMASPVRSCLRATLYRSLAVSAGAFRGSSWMTTG